MDIYELKVKVYLLKDIKVDETQSYLAYFIDSILVKNRIMLKYMNKIYTNIIHLIVYIHLLKIRFIKQIIFILLESEQLIINWLNILVII